MEHKLLLLGFALLLIGCSSLPKSNVMAEKESLTPSNQTGPVLLSNLEEGPNSSSFRAIKASFQARNPGYDLDFLRSTGEVAATDSERILFVQKGGGSAKVSTGDTSKISVGDIVFLHSDESMQTDSLIDYLSFTMPDVPPAKLPRFIRPDWDPHITDIPGGCATETGAYRRILLTWLGKVGPYLYHSINAHRVRIMDSFSHYHPKDNGFDEFYLVQMAMPGAKIITSEHTELIENYENLKPKKTKGLIQEMPLRVGDLLYLPRGVIHRGFGGVLAQVITVPGFIPGSEIGVDYHLRKINEKFDLKGESALPYNVAASDSIVIK